MLATWMTEPIAFISGLEGLPWEGLVSSLAAVRSLFGDWQCQLQHSPLGELGKLHCPLTASVSSSVRWGHESALFIGLLSELEVNSHKALGARLSAREVLAAVTNHRPDLRLKERETAAFLTSLCSPESLQLDTDTTAWRGWGLWAWTQACRPRPDSWQPFLGPGASQATLMIKNLPAVPEMQETWVQSRDQEDALEEEMATHSWNSHGQRSLAGYSRVAQRVKESDTTECTHRHTDPSPASIRRSYSLPESHNLFFTRVTLFSSCFFKHSLSCYCFVGLFQVYINPRMNCVHYQRFNVACNVKISILYLKKTLVDVFNLFLNPNHKCICVCICAYRWMPTYSPISIALEYIKKFFLAKSCGFQDLGSPTRDWTWATVVKALNCNRLEF